MADMVRKAIDGPSSPIQIAREDAELSREGLAFKSGMSLRTIERIEAGQSRPHQATIRAIAGALDLSVTDLEDFGSDWDRDSSSKVGVV